MAVTTPIDLTVPQDIARAIIRPLVSNRRSIPMRFTKE
jgi:hypothetical protein